MAMATRFLETKVLELIFSNLGRTDLLNVRLVCKNWNQDCLNFFKTSTKFRLTLDHENWNDYIQFVSSTPVPLLTRIINICLFKNSKPQPVMPIHLKFKSLGEGEHNSAIGEDTEDEEDDDVYLNIKNHHARNFQEFALAVKKLQNLLGSHCIKGLDFFYAVTYGYDGYDGFVEEFVKILSDLSPGLEKLEIWLDCDCDFPSKENWKIVFPKVKHLKFKWFIKYNYSPPLEGKKTPWQLIQACPNLETLIVGKTYDMDIIHWPSELSFPPPGIKSLKLGRFPNDWLLKKMQQHPSLPALQKLSLSSGFRIIGKDNDKRSNCREILRLFSPSLRTLSMRLVYHDFMAHENEIQFDEMKDSESEVYRVPFPVFPALRNLTFKNLTYRTDPIGASFKIDPAAFPALKSVTIPFDLSLNEQDEEPESNLTQFSSVKSLSLLGYDLFDDFDSDSDDEDEDVGQYLQAQEERNLLMLNQIKHFHTMFPNISTIVFHNLKNAELEEGVLIRQHLKKYLQLPEASKIQVLEMSGFDRNYLGEVLEQIHYPRRLVLENVRTNPLLEDALEETFNELTRNLGYGLEDEVRTREEIVTQDANRSVVCLTTAEEVNSPFKNCMTNIRKIRLCLNEETRALFIKECKYIPIKSKRSEYRQALDAPKKLYVNEMMANFPHLEEIEVSSHLFGRDAVGRAERIQRIRGKFPGLKINII